MIIIVIFILLSVLFLVYLKNFATNVTPILPLFIGLFSYMVYNVK